MVGLLDGLQTLVSWLFVAFVLEEDKLSFSSTFFSFPLLILSGRRKRL